MTLPTGWTPVADVAEAARTAVVRELARELGRRHSLHGRCVALAAVGPDDDILVSLDDGRVAVVHLTWRGAVEPPPWPEVVVFADLQAFLRCQHT